MTKMDPVKSVYSLRCGTYEKRGEEGIKRREIGVSFRKYFSKTHIVQLKDLSLGDSVDGRVW